MQKREGVRRVARYELGVQSKSEQIYDTRKLEYRGVIKVFKKLRYQLYGVRFILETNANILVAQLNRLALDLPRALVTRQLTQIRLFDFDIKYIPRTKNSTANSLSRKPATPKEIEEQEKKRDINKFIVAKISYLRVTVSPVETIVSVKIPVS